MHCQWNTIDTITHNHNMYSKCVLHCGILFFWSENCITFFIVSKDSFYLGDFAGVHVYFGLCVMEIEHFSFFN